ncbi:MAG TPA: hypothetical protein VHI11_09485 [Jiangellaceae bacterium]|nr:hypothetical protein [Jiangellaceae bacterium]
MQAASQPGRRAVEVSNCLPTDQGRAQGMIDHTVVVARGVDPMAFFDRMTETFTTLRGAFSGRGDNDAARDAAPDEVPDLPVDVEARRMQLKELDAALTALAQQMSADADRMRNPGWRGRVEDIQFGAAECSRLRRKGFDRAALLDLAAEVRLLYGSGPVPPEYAPFQAAHERVVEAAAAVRGPLQSESGPSPAD